MSFFILKHFNRSGKRPHKTSSRGFTLIEVMIVLVIMLIITATAVSQYLPFQSRVEYENTVLDIALNIRQFQIFGVGTKQSQTGGAFSMGYGLHLHVNGDGAKPYKIVFYEDTDNDGSYDSGDSDDMACKATPTDDTCIKTLTFPSNEITKASLTNSSGIVTTFSVTNPGMIDITFKRPYLDAAIVGTLDSSGVSTQYYGASLCLDLPEGGQQLKITISRTGQLSAVPQTNTTSADCI